MEDLISSPQEAKRSLESFSFEDQKVLIALLDDAELGESLPQVDKIKFATFKREFLPAGKHLGDPSSTLVQCYREVNVIDEDLNYSDETLPPEVFGKYPEGEVGGVVEAIRFQIRDGPIEHRQVDLTSLEIILDGGPLSFEVKSEFRLTPGEPYAEILTITAPVDHLSPGQHSVRVSVSDSGGNSGVSEWTFRIAVPPPDPTTETLRTTRDSILSAQSPHRNEGANPLLQLSHRPEERNKANNPIVGFDLSGVNLAAVTKATLVLEIHECELPKKWGSQGRNILAYPVNEDWVEGNGQTIRVGQGEETRGSGQGVTPDRRAAL